MRVIDLLSTLLPFIPPPELSALRLEKVSTQAAASASKEQFEKAFAEFEDCFRRKGPNDRIPR